MSVYNRNVLLLQEKWADIRPELGLSNSFHNVLTTFARFSNNNKFHIIHHDEALITYGKHIDTFLVDYCIKYSIDTIIIMLVGKSPSNPSEETYKKLRAAGIYLVFLWPDSGGDPDYGILKAHELIQYGLNVLWDNPKSRWHDSFPEVYNIMKLWVPQDLSFFYPVENQDIECSFIGSTTNYQDRNYFINNLKQVMPSFKIKGGQRQDALGMDEYASFIRRSKISLGFPLSLAQFWQTKGRIFEIFASKSMLLEMKNPATPQLFEPGVDYIEFEQVSDLIEKIEYYLKNKEERKKIAAAGHKKYMENYTANHYWKAIFDRIEKDTKII